MTWLLGAASASDRPCTALQVLSDWGRERQQSATKHAKARSSRPRRQAAARRREGGRGELACPRGGSRNPHRERSSVACVLLGGCCGAEDQHERHVGHDCPEPGLVLRPAEVGGGHQSAVRWSHLVRLGHEWHIGRLCWKTHLRARSGVRGARARAHRRVFVTLARGLDRRLESFRFDSLTADSQCWLTQREPELTRQRADRRRTFRRSTAELSMPSFFCPRC